MSQIERATGGENGSEELASLRRAEAEATTSRNSSKKKWWKLVIGFAILAALLIFNKVSVEEKEAKKAASRDVARERVVAKDFTIPAGGTLEIRKELQCHVTNLNDEVMKKVVQESLSETVRLTSSDTVGRAGRIWFFDEGSGNCASDFRKVNALGLLR